MTGSAKATSFIDNERVIVTEYRFAARRQHRLASARPRLCHRAADGRQAEDRSPSDGDSFAEMKKGVPYFRNEGVEHDVINANDGEYAFIEIELK